MLGRRSGLSDWLKDPIVIAKLDDKRACGLTYHSLPYVNFMQGKAGQPYPPNSSR